MKTSTNSYFITMIASSDFDLIFVTGNAKKLEEVNLYLKSQGITRPVQNIELDLPELQGDNCSEISAEKCKLAYQELVKRGRRYKFT